jgi:outer membrane protein insertion porin family
MSRAGRVAAAPAWLTSAAAAAWLCFLALGVPDTADAQPAPDPADSAAGGAIAIELRGNDRLTDAELLASAAHALTRLRTGRGSAAAAVDDAEYLIARAYRRVGRLFATVTHSLRGPPQRPQAVTFTIAEGPEVRVVEVEIFGARAFRAHQLRADVLDSLRIDGRPVYVAERLDAAVTALRSRYRQAGYVAAEVAEPQIDFVSSPDAANGPPDQARIALEIREGPQFLIRDIRLVMVEPDPPGIGDEPAGTDRAAAAAFARLRGQCDAVLAQWIDRPYRRLAHAEIADRLSEFLRERGRFAASASVRADLDDRLGNAVLTVRCVPGPVYTIGDVEFDGRTISPSFLRSIIPLKPNSGRRYSPAREREAQRLILRTNLVRDIRVVTEPDPIDATVDYRFEIDEIPSAEIRPHIGWGAYDLLRGYLQLAEHNAFGVGRTIDVTVGVSVRSHWAEIGLRDPWLLGPATWPLQLTGFYARRRERAFTRQDLGARFTLEHLPSPLGSIAVFLEYRDTRAFDFTGTTSSEPTALLGTIGTRLRISTAHPELIPLSGFRMTVTVEHASQLLGSTLEFSRAKAEGAIFIPISRDDQIVLALGGLIEAIFPSGDTPLAQIPAQERVYNGGATSVRSYVEQGMRPFDNPDSPFGGQIRTVGSLELRFPLIWEGGLDMGLFVDIGNLAPDLDRALNHWRMGLGAGLRYLTPIGPARIDVAWNPYPQAGENRWALHFWIGFPF